MKDKREKKIETFNKANSGKREVNINGKEEILQSDHHPIQSHSFAWFCLVRIFLLIFAVVRFMVGFAVWVVLCALFGVFWCGFAGEGLFV